MYWQIEKKKTLCIGSIGKYSEILLSVYLLYNGCSASVYNQVI